MTNTNFMAATNIILKYNRNYSLEETREMIFAVAENYEFNVSFYNYNRNMDQIEFGACGEFDDGFSSDDSFQMFADEICVMLSADYCVVDEFV
jgi:hypothetical protein